MTIEEEDAIRKELLECVIDCTGTMDIDFDVIKTIDFVKIYWAIYG